MRRAAALVVLLTACAAPTGAAVDFCGPDWQRVEPVIVTPDAGEPEPVPIVCVRRIGESRVRIGFEMPPGPECHRLTGVELEEGAESVAVTVLVSPANDPLAGTCAPRGIRTMTEVDLQAPIGERVLLDGSR